MLHSNLSLSLSLSFVPFPPTLYLSFSPLPPFFPLFFFLWQGPCRENQAQLASHSNNGLDIIISEILLAPLGSTYDLHNLSRQRRLQVPSPK